MRVLHVITGLNAGGAEHQLRLLLRHQLSDAEVVTLTDPGVVAGLIRADGHPVYELEMGGNTACPRCRAWSRSSTRDGTTSCTRTCTGPACTGGWRPGWPAYRWSWRLSTRWARSASRDAGWARVTGDPRVLPVPARGQRDDAESTW